MLCQKILKLYPGQRTSLILVHVNFVADWKRSWYTVDATILWLSQLPNCRQLVIRKTAGIILGRFGRQLLLPAAAAAALHQPSRYGWGAGPSLEHGWTSSTGGAVSTNQVVPATPFSATLSNEVAAASTTLVGTSCWIRGATPGEGGHGGVQSWLTGFPIGIIWDGPFPNILILVTQKGNKHYKLRTGSGRHSSKEKTNLPASGKPLAAAVAWVGIPLGYRAGTSWKGKQALAVAAGVPHYFLGSDSSSCCCCWKEQLCCCGRRRMGLRLRRKSEDGVGSA